MSQEQPHRRGFGGLFVRTPSTSLSADIPGDYSHLAPCIHQQRHGKLAAQAQMLIAVFVGRAELQPGEAPARHRPAREYASRLAGDVKKALTGGKKAEAAAAEAVARVVNLYLTGQHPNFCLHPLLGL